MGGWTRSLNPCKRNRRIRTRSSMDHINKFNSTPLPSGSLPRFVQIPGAFEPCDLDHGEPLLPAIPAWDRGPGKVGSALPESASHPKGAILVRFDDGSAAGFNLDELLWTG